MRKRPPDWIAIVAAPLLGGLAGGVFWSAVNQIVRINGRGVLERQGFPFDQPVFFVGFFAVAWTVAIWIRRYRERKLTADLVDVAAALGLVFDDPDDGSEPETRPNVPLFLKWYESRNRLSGLVDGRPAEMFDLTVLDPDAENPSTSRWTVILFREVDVPSFNCSPRTFASAIRSAFAREMSFDGTTSPAVSEFNRRRILTTDAEMEEPLRRFLAEPKLAALARTPRRHVQAADGCLVVAVPGSAPAARRLDLWREATELRRELLTSTPASFRPVLPEPVEDRSRRDHRRRYRSAGAIAGTVAGFFGGFACFAAAMLSGLDDLFGVGVLAAFPFAVFGGLILGVCVGVLIGGWAAEWTYRSDAAQPVQVGAAWVVVGGFLGWGIGAVGWAALSPWILPAIGPKWALPLVFFTPPIVCLILGGFAGHAVGKASVIRRRNRDSGAG